MSLSSGQEVGIMKLDYQRVKCGTQNSGENVYDYEWSG